VERVEQSETVAGDEGGGVSEVRAGGGEGEADIEEGEVGLGGEQRVELGGLSAQSALGFGGEQEGQSGRRSGQRAGQCFSFAGGRSFFEDDRW
jgi:hypothetical protein